MITNLTLACRNLRKLSVHCLYAVSLPELYREIRADWFMYCIINATKFKTCLASTCSCLIGHVDHWKESNRITIDLFHSSHILIHQGVHCCTKVCNLRVLRTVRVVIQPESSGCSSYIVHCCEISGTSSTTVSYQVLRLLPPWQRKLYFW